MYFCDFLSCFKYTGTLYTKQAVLVSLSMPGRALITGAMQMLS